VPYRQPAADTATRRQAYPEAIAALTKGLALLATLPESPARAQHELTLLLLLGPRLMAAQGYAVPAVGERYTRALTLAQQVWGSRGTTARRSRASPGCSCSGPRCAGQARWASSVTSWRPTSTTRR
jgi:adenylate cyclase